MSRKTLATFNPKVLEAVKEAHLHGRKLTASQCRAQSELVRRGHVTRLDSGAIVVERRGRLVFRKGHGVPGPDYDVHPNQIVIRKLERDFIRWKNKHFPRMPTKAASRARTEHAQRPEVEHLLRKYGLTDRYACGRVARTLHLSHAYVRKIRNEMRLTEGKP